MQACHQSLHLTSASSAACSPYPHQLIRTALCMLAGAMLRCNLMVNQVLFQTSNLSLRGHLNSPPDSRPCELELGEWRRPAAQHPYASLLFLGHHHQSYFTTCRHSKRESEQVQQYFWRCARDQLLSGPDGRGLAGTTLSPLVSSSVAPFLLQIALRTVRSNEQAATLGAAHVL